MGTVPHLSPWLRAAFRVPDHLYRHNLGRLLGHRFLRLTHRGRRSGHRYTTVLEVVRYDRQVPEFTVVSGFGPRTDWLRNIEAGGPVMVTVGRSTFIADHRRLHPEEAVRAFADYERRNRLVGPMVRRLLGWLVGWRYDGSPAARRRLSSQLPLIAFRPTAGPGAHPSTDPP
jgi:deazaflavin-dependent oxidoreductase (nitroreductase family)